MSAKFITDNGGPLELRDAEGNPAGEIPRYGVWGETGRGKPQVIECHNDLARMQSEHGVPDERVFVLPLRTDGATPGLI